MIPPVVQLNPQNQDYEGPILELYGITPKKDHSYFFSQPPTVQELVNKELVAKYRKNLSLDITRSTFEETRIQAAGFLSEISSRTGSVKNTSAYAIAAGFATNQTPHDTVKGDFVDLFADPQIRKSIIDNYTSGIRYAEIINHICSLEARIAMQNQKVDPLRVCREFEPIEQIIREGRGISWNDLGWGINERLIREGPEDESTKYIRAQGLWTRLCRSPGGDVICNPILGPSHPDLNSALVLADLALIGSISFVPCDGPYVGTTKDEGLRNQVALLKTAIELIEKHPLVYTHPDGNYLLSDNSYVRQHMVEEAKKRVGITLKPHPPTETGERAKYFYEKEGVKIFRVFDPRDTESLPKAIAEIRKHCPDAVIIASQVTGVASAKRCYEAGANAVILNIGDGGHCSTASGMHMIPNNPITFYRIQLEQSLRELGIILDGGVGAGWIMALAMGATGAMKHGSLIGGTINQTPCFHGLIDPSTGKYVKLYSGEAAPRNKYRGGNLDPTGEPDNEEGKDSHVDIYDNPLGTTVSEIMYRDFHRALAKQLGFWRATRVEQLAQWECPVVLLPTSGARQMAAPHYKGGSRV